MYLNMLVDGLIGLVPLLGDVADGIYKCNTRNVSILEAELEKRGKERIAAQKASDGQIDPPPRYAEDHNFLTPATSN
jgi:Domain of unknown function (DUF4112)